MGPWVGTAHNSFSGMGYLMDSFANNAFGNQCRGYPGMSGCPASVSSFYRCFGPCGVAASTAPPTRTVRGHFALPAASTPTQPSCHYDIDATDGLPVELLQFGVN